MIENYPNKDRATELNSDWVVSVNAFYEKVIKVKADVAAFLINCFSSA